MINMEKLRGMTVEELQAAMCELMKENKELKKEGYILEKGLPPLGACLVSVTQPGFGNHFDLGKPVERVLDIEFALLPLELDHKKPSSLWRRVEESGSLPEWNHENHIQSFCADALKDVAALANIEIKLGSEVNLSILEKQRADIVVIKSGGRLVGMCEAMKPSVLPSPADLQNPELDSQVCNYLQLMRSIHGCKCPIGIISTYEHWAVIWLDTSCALAAAKRITCDLISLPSEGNREPLYFSKIMHRSDRDLPLFLATALAKMVNGEKENAAILQRISGQDGRKFGRVVCNGTADDFCWEALPLGLKPSFQLPASTTTHFYLLQDFHGGADGRVWLACNGSGKICVIKLSSVLDFTEEAALWCTVWKVSARSTLILKANALIMPFAFHGLIIGGKVVFRPLNNWCGSDSNITVNDFANSEAESIDNEALEIWFSDPLKAALEAVMTMAKAGFVHNDLQWRHVALLPVEQEPGFWTVKPILIDLTRVRRLEEGETVEEVVERAKDYLQKFLM